MPRLQKAIADTSDIRGQAFSFMDAFRVLLRQQSAIFAKQLDIPVKTYTSWTFQKLGLPTEGFAVLPQQDAATVELQRHVGVLEATLTSDDYEQAQRSLEKGEQATRILRDYLAKGSIEMPTLTSGSGGCPKNTWRYTDPKLGDLCCPTELRRGRCLAKKSGTRYRCAPESNEVAYKNGKIPVCVPEPQQGPCQPDYFFFGRAEGGGCCPVKPIAYSAVTKDFAICPRPVGGGDVPRVACALKAENPWKWPVCATEGFQVSPGSSSLAPSSAAFQHAMELRGKDLLDYTDSLLKEAEDFVLRVGMTRDALVAARPTLSDDLNKLVFRLPGSSLAPSPSSSPSTNVSLAPTVARAAASETPDVPTPYQGEFPASRI
jgi:hypothetical protein